MNQLPDHVAIILDGNRRWARERKRPTFFGHAAGTKQTKNLVDHLKNRGVKIVTLYAFSTENWKRQQTEVSYLMKLFTVFLKNNIKKFHTGGGRLNFIGDISPIPDHLKKMIEEAIELTKENNKFVLQLALNYGGRDEIVRAIKKIINSGVKADAITENVVGNNLDTAGVPDPDLIIRTSGEQRLSNFLNWQSAYSELYFAPEHLPDFTVEKLDQALDMFASRKRRHGQ